MKELKITEHHEDEFGELHTRRNITILDESVSEIAICTRSDSEGKIIYDVYINGKRDNHGESEVGNISIKVKR